MEEGEEVDIGTAGTLVVVVKENPDIKKDENGKEEEPDFM
jgi:hypothetical protein